MGEEDSAASAAASVDLGPPEEAINPKNFKERKTNHVLLSSPILL